MRLPFRDPGQWSQNVFDNAAEAPLVFVPRVGVEPPRAPVDQRGRKADSVVGG